MTGKDEENCGGFYEIRIERWSIIHQAEAAGLVVSFIDASSKVQSLSSPYTNCKA